MLRTLLLVTQPDLIQLLSVHSPPLQRMHLQRRMVCMSPQPISRHHAATQHHGLARRVTVRQIKTEFRMRPRHRTIILTHRN